MANQFLIPDPANVPSTLDNLIKSRLITIETKALTRVTKLVTRFQQTDNLLNEALSSLSAPAKDETGNVEMADAATAATDATVVAGGGDVTEERTKPSAEQALQSAADKLAEEVLLEFAPLEEALMRIQLLTIANRKDVERYQEKRDKIEKASEKATTDMTTLRTSLAEAEQLKKHKLEYDVIATEITTSPNSQKTRQMQLDSIARLNGEIDALEREKAEYGKVWLARRGQFGAIVEALMGMQAQIQEDKEEQERREGLDDDDDEEAQKGENEKDKKEEEKKEGEGEGAKEDGETKDGDGKEKAEGGDVVMGDSQLEGEGEDGGDKGTVSGSVVTSPRFEDGEHEEGEEPEDGSVGEVTHDEGSIREGGSREGTPDPRSQVATPREGEFEEMETDERSHPVSGDEDDEMEDETTNPAVSSPKK